MTTDAIKKTEDTGGLLLGNNPNSFLNNWNLVCAFLTNVWGEYHFCLMIFSFLFQDEKIFVYVRRFTKKWTFGSVLYFTHRASVRNNSPMFALLRSMRGDSLNHVNCTWTNWEYIHWCHIYSHMALNGRIRYRKVHFV